MLSVILKVLSILGILLLCLLALVLLTLLLVLFFPVCYKVSGEKAEERMTAAVRASWLFGLLRVSYDYPEPGRVLVKLLPFTVFDSGKKAKEVSDKEAKKANGAAKAKTAKQQEQTAPRKAASKTPESGNAETRAVSKMPEEGQQGAEKAVSEMTVDEQEKAALKEEGSIFKKFKKIKYTFYSIYDKIKKIWENISYYIELLREEETKQLFSHAIFRAGRILKSIRPRHIRGNLLFGTGAPDTTGYAYGVYGMFSPFLGPRLLVTPDFTQAILEGNVYISGHITVFTILWNGMKLLLDRKLRRFIQKMKAGRKK